MELRKIAEQTNSSGPRSQHRKYIFKPEKVLERNSVENFLPLLLQPCPPVKSASHSPSDPGICMDSEGEDTFTNIPRVHPTQELNRGSDSAHSSNFSSSSSSSSTFSLSSCSSPTFMSDTRIEEAVSMSDTRIEEAVSMAYIDESKTVHSYIASRGQRECELDIYEVRPPCLRVTKKIVEVVRV